MTIVVTGAAGFIGSQVVELLSSHGKEVIGIDSMNDAYDIRLKQWRLDRLIDLPGVQFHGADITDLQGCEDVIGRRNVEAVVNLAARAGVRASIINPRSYFDTNVLGCINLLELCRRHDIPTFILASSSSVYGAGAQVPFNEDMPTDAALSPYAASKKAAEVLCHSYFHIYGLSVTALRFFTVYGPAGRPDMSPFRFVQWISEGLPVRVYGDGKQSRDFTYVGDIARGTVAALDLQGFNVVNLGSDRPVELRHLIRLIEELTGRQARLEYSAAVRSDVPATWADIRRANDLLGWRPMVEIDHGVGSLVDWYRKNRDWARRISTTD